MSDFSEHHFDAQSSPNFNLPQSAQPYTSLFGGPSSQDVDLELYAETQRDDGQDELDIIMGEQPVIDNDLSDDATYRGTDEDGSASDDAISEGSARQETRKKEKSVVVPPKTSRDPNSPPSPPGYRRNRFRGPESTWRKFTLEDRQNAQALETIRARNLAAHLYNAHALRVRAREMAQRAADSADPVDEGEMFLPHKRWTAWPMPASEVPRADEYLRREADDAWTLRMQPDPRPSAELEESVIAIMLQSAKERFEARRWEPRHSSWQSGGGGRMRSEDVEASTGQEGDYKSDPEPVDRVLLRPVVQADDDKSRRQLRPMARNVITQFDQLLMGLHHARKGGMAGDDSSASEWQTDTESVLSGRSTSPGKRVLDKTARSQSRGRKRTRRSSFSAKTTSGRSHSVHTSRGRELSRHTSRFSSRSRHSSGYRGRSVGSDRTRSASRIRLGVRDWSEVLGIASMIGWPPAVVMRAARRCNGLFGEDMMFQTLKEGKMQQVETEVGMAWKYEESESEEEAASSSPSPPPSRGSSKRPRSRAASTVGGSVSRPSSAMSGNHDGSRSTSRPKGKGEHRRLDLVCPLKTCTRHDRGFSRVWNLNLHMKRMHPGYRTRSTDRKSPANVGGSIAVDDDDE